MTNCSRHFAAATDGVALAMTLPLSAPLSPDQTLLKLALGGCLLPFLVITNYGLKCLHFSSLLFVFLTQTPELLYYFDKLFIFWGIFSQVKHMVTDMLVSKLHCHVL